MKKKLLLGFSLFGILLTSNAQNGIEEILRIPWNSEDGCKTEYQYGKNQGLSAFTIIDENEIAVLCDIENKIKIFNVSTGQINNVIEISTPYQFNIMGYSKYSDSFYLIYRDKLYVYSRNGEYKEMVLNKKIRYVIHFESFANNTYLVSGESKSYPVFLDGKFIRVDDQINKMIDGRITHENQWLKLTKKNSATYSLETLTNESKSENEITIKSKAPESGLSIIGQSDKNIFFLLIDILTVKPIKTDERVLVYSKTSNSLIGEIDIPNIYYTSVLNSKIIHNNYLYNLLTTPNSAIIHKIDVNVKNKEQEWDITFPDEFNYEYHYNKDTVRRRLTPASDYQNT